MKRPDRAVIPVAGFATRMHPLSRAIPKELLPLGRRPVLHHVVEELARAGATQFQMVTSERTRAIEQYFGRDDQLDTALAEAGLEEGWSVGDRKLSRCSLQFVRQEEPHGIGDAIHRSRAFVDGRPFFLHMGDSVVTGDLDLLERMADAHERHDAVLSVAVQQLSDEEIRAHATVVPRGASDTEVFEVAEIIEKPLPEEMVAPAALIGRYLISAPMLETPRSGDLHASPLGGFGGIFPERRHLDGPVLAVWCRAEARVHDAGTLDAYLRAQAYFALRDPTVGHEVLGLLRGVEP